MSKSFTQFNRMNVDVVRAELQKVLDKYGSESNLRFSLGRIGYNTGEIQVKLTVNINGQKSVAEQQLELVMKQFNLKKQGHGGRVLEGYNSRNWKYPFLFTHNGRRMKCSTANARLYFGQ